MKNSAVSGIVRLASIVIILLVSASHIRAQRIITLEECISTAIENSFDAHIAKLQLQASESAAEAARKSLYSTIDLSFDAPDYYRRLDQQFNTETGRLEFYPLERLQWTGRLSIDQPVIWTNSRLSISGSLYRQDQSGESLDEGYYREYFSNVSIVLRQPLFVPNSQALSLRRAQIDYEEALADYRRATLDLVYNVTEGFYRLYSTQQQERIQRDRVAQQDESYTTAQRKYKSGLIAEVEALQFEVDLATARNDLFSAENKSMSEANTYKMLVGLPLDSDLKLVLTDTTFTTFPIDVDQAIGEAKRTRVDLKRAYNNIERSEASLEEVEAQRTIRGDLTFSYGFSNNDDKLNQLLVDIRDTRGAMFTLTVPVFDWGKHSEDVQGAQARLQTAQLQAQRTELRVEQEIRDLVRQIESSARRVEVLYKSRLVAEKANDINTKRFEVGTIGATELAQSQSRLLQARLSALEALIDYNVAIADLTRKTAYDFKLARSTSYEQ